MRAPFNSTVLPRAVSPGAVSFIMTPSRSSGDLAECTLGDSRIVPRLIVPLPAVGGPPSRQYDGDGDRRGDGDHRADHGGHPEPLGKGVAGGIEHVDPQWLRKVVADGDGAAECVACSFSRTSWDSCWKY